MRFTQGKRRAAPSVIIVSLIDVLLVVLIFLMVSTTFRQTPSVKLALPEARQAEKQGVSPNRMVVTITPATPSLYLGTRPITVDKLEEELTALARQNTNLSLTIQADEGSQFGIFMRVMDAAKSAGIRTIDASTRAPAGR